MATILLDCDGVLADFVGHMIKALRAVGHDVADDVTAYDFLRQFGEKTGNSARAILGGRDFWRTLPPYDEAQWGVEAMREHGHTIVVATSPWISCVGWAETRRTWLDKHFDVDHGDVLVGMRKEMIRAGAFVDDRAEVVQKWDAENHRHNNDGIALLMDRGWTKSAPASLRRFSWCEEHVEAVCIELEARG